MTSDIKNPSGGPLDAPAAYDSLPEATLTETTEFGEACPLSPQPVNTVAAAGRP